MGSASLSYYDALGVPRDAPPSKIKAAFHRQCLALHPDKNSFGESLMRYINEAYEVLSDKSARASYDRNELLGQRGGNGAGPDAAGAAQIRRLKQKLADSEKKRSLLLEKFVVLKDEVEEAREELDEAHEELEAVREELSQSQSSAIEKARQIKKLKRKLQASDQERRRLQNDVDHLRSENGLLDRENGENKRRMDVYENKVEKSNRTLREERRKATHDLARADERAQRELEDVREELSRRSVCYRCNGRAASAEDCAVCEGRGAVQGIWTRCHRCDGSGSVATIGGERKGCDLCDSRGAREGLFAQACFKCDGSGKDDCDVCFGGKIRGFNIKLCPFCRGKGECENCFGRAYVSCQCGPSCVGHTREEIATPIMSSLLKSLASANVEQDDEQDWSAKFLTRNWISPI